MISWLGHRARQQEVRHQGCVWIPPQVTGRYQGEYPPLPCLASVVSFSRPTLNCKHSMVIVLPF
jgi:hypothetical protein